MNLIGNQENTILAADFSYHALFLRSPDTADRVVRVCATLA